MKSTAVGSEKEKKEEEREKMGKESYGLIFIHHILIQCFLFARF